MLMLMSAVETGQMSAVETRQMSSAENDRCPQVRQGAALPRFFNMCAVPRAHS